MTIEHEGNKYHFFWGGMFSNWFPSKFSIDDITYNCGEQYMMAQKAILFRDNYSELLIMKTKNPKTHQLLGRNVKNFNQEVWDAHKYDIVYTGNYHRFQQNEELRELLFSTRGTTLVETNPNDSIWGIGLSRNDPRALNRETWNGQNLLGEILTKVREDLLENASKK